jgi:hypothetical protein
MQLGQCAEIDRPGGIIVQDATTSGTASGYYQLFEETTLLHSPESGTPSPGTQSHGHGFRFGPAVSKVVDCAQLQRPTKDFLVSCPLPLEGKKATRVCFDNKFVTTTDNGAINYPASLLDLIVDEKLLSTNKFSDYDYNWTSVTPVGCRDLVGVSKAYVMVGPSASGGFYDPTKIKSIRFTKQTIDWDQ